MLGRAFLMPVIQALCIILKTDNATFMPSTEEPGYLRRSIDNYLDLAGNFMRCTGLPKDSGPCEGKGVLSGESVKIRDPGGISKSGRNQTLSPLRALASLPLLPLHTLPLRRSLQRHQHLNPTALGAKKCRAVEHCRHTIQRFESRLHCYKF